MKTFLISYDLNQVGQNYSNLISAIKAYGYYAKIQESVWAVKSNASASEIRDNLNLHIDSNDELFVCRFDNWASYGLDSRVVNWLNEPLRV